MTQVDISELVGKVFTSVRREDSYRDDNDSIVFENDDEKFVLTHRQDCCESVNIEEIHGLLSDLEGAIIRVAAEDKSYTPPEGTERDEYADQDEQWCFYTFRTAKGTVTVRFYGTSNGYYSTDADLHRV